MPVVVLLVAYDGGNFSGFAANPGVRTVSGELSAALERVLREPVELTCSGRTDAGVHAWGQVVSFVLDAEVDLTRLQRSLVGLLAPEIAVRAITVGPEGFDARFSATSRTYRYTLLRSLAPSPFLARTTWHVPEELDLDAMRQAAAGFVGTHDFRSFCRAKHVLVAGEEVEASSVRDVLRAHISPAPDDCWRFEIEASSFCHQMVRSITGTLVDIGRGRRPADAVPAMLAARDRHAAGNMAPASGLCLWSVRFGSLHLFANIPGRFAGSGLPGPGGSP